MLFLVLMLSCTFRNFNVQEKGRREDISKAIQNPDNENSRAILEKVNKYTALHKNENGLLPIEEAIEAENVEAVRLLIKVGEYPDKIYERIVNKRNIDLFNLIPQENLEYRLLSRMKENKDGELEREFLKRIEATELEKLIVSGKIEEIKKKSKGWFLDNYKDDRGYVNQRKINTAEILCIYGGIDFIKEIIKILEKDIKDIKEYLLFTVSKLGKREAIKYLLGLGIDVNQKLDGGWKAIMYAAFNGHKEVCQLLIEKGVDVNSVKKDGMTVLMLAAENGNKEVCQLLIEEGADVNASDLFGSTALMIAASNGHKEVCQLLIDNNSEVNAKKQDGSTALMIAVSNGHKEVCRLLIEKGADVNASDLFGSTALMIAASNGHKEVCQLLIDNNSKVSAKKQNGWTALMIALQNGHKELCRLLIDNNSEVNAVEKYGRTALILAAQNGNKELCRLLIDNNSEVNAVEKYGRTALILAASNGHKEVCHLLIEERADVNASDLFGSTALMIAASNGHKEVCQLLIDNNSEVNAVDKDGSTALMIASEEGYKEVCQLLIGEGADVNSKSQNEWTALMLAALHGNKELCRLLIEEGADVNASDLFGSTALMIAALQKNKEVCQLLIEKGVDVNSVKKDGMTVLMLAALHGNKEVCQLLIEKGADVNALEQDGRTALIFALQNGHKELCQLLIDNNSEVNAKKQDGSTALMLAALHGNKEVCRLLIEKGADVNALEQDGSTALMWAANRGIEEVCQLLIDNNSEVNAKKQDGSTALMLAALHGNKELCQLLIDNGADVNAKKQDGSTALMLAALHGNKEVCQLLIDNGAYVNEVDKNGTTALMIASEEGYKEVCQLLIKKGAEVNSKKQSRWTALTRAVSNGHKEVCQLLIEKGADVNAVDLTNRTPLVISAESGRKEIIEILINATVQASLDNGQPCYEYSEEQIRYLKETLSNMGISVDILRISNKPLLTDALEAGRADICKFLLSFDEVKIDLSSEDGWNVLMKVVEKKHMDVFTLLLDKVMEVVAGDKDRFRSFMSRVTKSSREIVDLFMDRLLENGLNDSTRKHLGYIDLYVEPILENMFLRNYFDELSLNYLEASQVLGLDFLSDNFYKIQTLNRRRYSPIHFAAMNRNFKILESVVSNEMFSLFVDNCQNIENISPLNLALREGFLNNAKALIAAGASPFYVKSSPLNAMLYKLFGRGIEAEDILQKYQELKDYVSSEMLLDLLRKGNLAGAQKRIYGPSFPVIKQQKAHNLLEKKQKLPIKVATLRKYEHAYKDIIDLSSVDNEGRNVFHYLARCIEDIATSEFLNKACKLKSFSKELLIQEDTQGMRPIHEAILNSNPYFIQHVSSLESSANKKLLANDEMKLMWRDKTIYDLVAKNSVSKETVDAVLRYILKDEEMDNLNHRIIENNISKEDLRVIIDCVILKDLAGIFNYIFCNSKLAIDLEEIFIKAVNLSALECMDYMLAVVNKDTARGEVSIDIDAIKNRINIHNLCKTGKVESLKFILERITKDGLMREDKDGKIPLQVAAEWGRIEIVNFLLGCKPVKIGNKYEYKITNTYFEEEEVGNLKGHRDKFGRSLMHSAVLPYSSHMVTLFAELGFETNIEDNYGDIPVDYLRKIRTEPGDESKARLSTIYALFCAMLGEEFDPDSISSKCIHFAIRLGKDEIVKELLRDGYANMKDDKGNTPMHLLLEYNRTDLLRTLLSNTRNYRSKNNNGDTPLHLSKSEEAMKMIFDAALDIATEKELLSVKNKNNEPVLHSLVAKSKERDMLDPIRYALDSGADKKEVIRGGTNNGKNTMDIAKSLGVDKIEYLLEKHLANKKDMEFRQEIRNRNRARIEEYEKDMKDLEAILKSRRDANLALSGSGKYAIHFAVERNNTNLIEELVELNSKLDLEYKELNSYKLAIKEGFYESLKCLLELGDVLDVDSKGISVLEAAVEKGGKCSNIAFKSLPKSKRTKDKINCILRALEILIKRLDIEEDFTEKVGMLVNTIGSRRLHLLGNKTLLLHIIEISKNAKKELNEALVKKLIEVRGLEKVFSKDENGKSAFGELILMKNTNYLSIILGAVGRTLGKERNKYSKELLKHVNESIDKLITLENIGHLKLTFTECKGVIIKEVIKNAITCAVEKRKDSIVEELVCFLKDINSRDMSGGMFRLAIESKNIVLWRSVLKLEDVLYVDKLGESALELGVREGGNYAEVAMAKLDSSSFILQPFGIKAMVAALKVILDRAEVEERAIEMAGKLVEGIVKAKGATHLFGESSDSETAFRKMLFIRDDRYLWKLIASLKGSVTEDNNICVQYILEEVNNRIEELFDSKLERNLLLIMSNYKFGYIVDQIRGKAMDLAVERNNRYFIDKMSEIPLNDSIYKCEKSIEKGNYEFLEKLLKSTDVLEINGNNKSILELAVEKGDNCLGVALSALFSSNYTENRHEHILRSLKVLMEKEEFEIDSIEIFLSYVQNRKLEIEGSLILTELIDLGKITVVLLNKIIEVRGLDEVFVEDSKGSVLWKVLSPGLKMEELRNSLLSKIDYSRVHVEKLINELAKRADEMLKNRMEGVLLQLLERYSEDTEELRQEVLLLAVEGNKENIIENLCDMGVDINGEDEANSYRLAIENERCNSLVKLLEIGDVLDIINEEESVLEMSIRKGGKIAQIAVKALGQSKYKETRREAIVEAIKLELDRGMEEQSIKMLIKEVDILDTDVMGESVLEIVLKMDNRLSDIAINALRRTKRLDEGVNCVVRALKIQIEKVVKQSGDIKHIESLLSYLNGKKLELNSSRSLILNLIETRNLTLMVLDTILQIRGVGELFLLENKEALNRIMLMRDVRYLSKIVDEIDEDNKNKNRLSERIEEIAEEMYNKSRLEHLMLVIEKLGVSDNVRKYALYSAINQNSEVGIEKASVPRELINKEDENGINSYRLAIQWDKYKSFAKLLDLGSVLDKNSDGESVLEVALRKGGECAAIAVESLKRNEEERVNSFIEQIGNQEILKKLTELGFKVKAEGDQVRTKGYRDAIEDKDYSLLESLLSKGDVLDLVSMETEDRSVLEIALGKGGKYADVALTALPKSIYKINRASSIIRSIKIALDRNEIKEDLLKKIELLLKNLPSEEDLKLKDEPLLNRIVNEGVELFNKIIEVRGVGEIFKEYNNKVLDRIILMENLDYLTILIKAIKSKKNNDYVEELVVKVDKKLEELVEEDRVENLKVILKEYGSEFIIDRSREQRLGKLIYIAAREKKEKIVELLLGNFVSFVTKADLTRDKWRERLSKLIKKAGVKSGFPGAELVVGLIGELVKPKERKEGVDEIMYIDKLYREGKWALGIEIEGRRSLLKYFIESIKSFKEMSCEKLEKRMQSYWSKKSKGLKDWFKKEIGRIENSHITKRVLDSRDKSEDMVEGPEKEEYKLRVKNKLEEVFKELEGYNKIYNDYKKFIKEEVSKKNLEWDRDIKKKLFINYNQIIEARKKLESKVEEYKREEVRVKAIPIVI